MCQSSPTCSIFCFPDQGGGVVVVDIERGISWLERAKLLGVNSKTEEKTRQSFLFGFYCTTHAMTEESTGTEMGSNRRVDLGVNTW